MSAISRLRERIARDRRRLRRNARRRAALRAYAAKVRARLVVRRRKLKQLQEAAQNRGPSAAVRWALAQVGEVESPPYSNRGPKITVWQRSFGEWLVGQAWCGVFVGCALRAAGVQGINSRVAGVALIEDDARAGRNGFKSWLTATSGQAGDAVVLFGRGVHVELIVSRESWGYVTVGGNTSAEGSSGSQSNGGGVYRRRRPFSTVRGIARPNYA